MSTAEDQVLKIVVQSRAKDLKDQGIGYGNALNQIAQEYYKQFVLGEDTPLGKKGAQHAANVDWDAVVAAGAALVGVLGKIGGAIWRAVQNKKRKIEEIKTKITPWITDVYAA